ncbi:MBL fold metallo-hydrolase [Nonomuraea sp. SYSU D8015]|uniref:MBL fold metallo-hydrolase n=1 Tax=Nonomuraea sp. SYSU D8015 TaxID=2593644 RepID=UPI001660D26D|nr:MBL fold metallo-hydrolase [Nonomuraea sp. SYSU D8015]
MDVVELQPRLHHLRFPIGHAYLWAGPEGLTLIDTGAPGSAPAIAEAIRQVGRHPEELRTVLLTHFHEDHVGPAAELATWGDVQAAMAGMPRPEPVRVDRELDDADVIDLGGGVRAVAVAAPGHTPGSVTYHLPDLGVLFTGDTAARGPEGGDVILGVFNADPAGAAASFRRLAALDVEVACFGHGDPLVKDAGAWLHAAAERLPG